MTTDSIQDKQLRLKAHLANASAHRQNRLTQKERAKSGIELTRMQSFLDGGYDIFDVLENHAANTQMKIKDNKAIELDTEETYNSSLFKSLLSRLREQMKVMAH
tara:strand:+ start:154 stop:465 length:312 start_codon:yes stop_codon:yes gene_type:complete